LPKPQTAKY